MLSVVFLSSSPTLVLKDDDGEQGSTFGGAANAIVTTGASYCAVPEIQPAFRVAVRAIGIGNALRRRSKPLINAGYFLNGELHDFSAVGWQQLSF